MLGHRALPWPGIKARCPAQGLNRSAGTGLLRSRLGAGVRHLRYLQNPTLHHTEAEPLSGTTAPSLCIKAAPSFLSGCSGRSAVAFRKTTSTKKCCKYIHMQAQGNKLRFSTSKIKYYSPVQLITHPTSTEGVVVFQDPFSLIYTVHQNFTPDCHTLRYLLAII